MVPTETMMDANPTPGRDDSQGVNVNGELREEYSAWYISQRHIAGRFSSRCPDGRGGDDSSVVKRAMTACAWPSITQQNSTVSINGGMGFDRVYLNGAESMYSLHNCSSNACRIDSSTGGKLYLTSVEMLVFQSSSRRLTN